LAPTSAWGRCCVKMSGEAPKRWESKSQTQVESEGLKKEKTLEKRGGVTPAKSGVELAAKRK